jgi:hypothetical protein
MQCRATTGSTTIQCSAGAALESLSVNGSPVTIPSQPIPINHPIAVSGLNVQVSVAGIGLVNVPASGTLYLNRVRTQGEGTNSVKIEHATISLELSGQTSVLGFGPVGVTLFVDDQDLIEYALMAALVAVAAGAISLPPPQ